MHNKITKVFMLSKLIIRRLKEHQYLIDGIILLFTCQGLFDIEQKQCCWWLCLNCNKYATHVSLLKRSKICLCLLVGAFTFFLRIFQTFYILLLTHFEYTALIWNTKSFIISQSEIYTDEINISKYYLMKVLIS